MSDLTDAQLLEKIAHRHDHQAFTELYRRYGHAAYNFARYLTGGPDLAEDALQEAMVSVMRFASSFTPPESGSARSWILRIVANKCARLQKQERRMAEGRNVIAERHERPARYESAAHAAEHAELLDALRAGISRLGEQDRYLVALYYGAGLTFHEIAHDGKIPSSTAAHRVRKAIENLRVGLASLGFAAIGPMVSDVMVRDALTAGHQVPAALQGQVLQQVGRAGLRIASAASQRVATGKSAAALYACLLGTLAVAGGAYLSFSFTPPMQSSQPAAAVAVESNASDEPIYCVWTFENGPADDLMVFHGAWQWAEANAERAAGIQSSGEERVGLMLPVEIRPGTFWEVNLTIFVMLKPGQEGGAWAGRAYEMQERLAQERWQNNFRIDLDRSIQSRSFLLNDWTVTMYSNTKGRTEGYIVTSTPGDGKDASRIAVCFERCLVTRIELRELRGKDIPEEFRDMQTLIFKKNLKKAAMSMPATMQTR